MGRTGERRAPVRLCLGEVLGDEVPVDEMVEKGLNKIRPAVLEVEVVGVLPDIAGQERGLPLGERGHGVRGASDLQLPAIGDEPGPAATELSDRRRLEIVLELGEPAEIAIDPTPMAATTR